MGQDSTEINSDTCNRKRVRLDDSDVNSPESKLVRLDSSNSDTNSPDLVTDQTDSAKNVENEVESDDSGVNSPEAKRIQADLLNIFDESDEPMIQGLDSVIRSFEEEILVPISGDAGLTSNGGGSQPDLGYLLEASDDELGLPPTFSGEEDKVGELDPESSGSGPTGFGEMIGLGDDMPSYDSFEFGIGGEHDGNNYSTSYTNEGGDFVTLGGLFEYAEDNYAPAADISAVQWQPESLSAL